VTIKRTQDRIDKMGEVFTPVALVNQMLDRLPADLWTDPTKTFLDNSCGDGNFLVEVLRHKIAAGSTPTQALETTYGVELMPDNVRECKRRLLEIAGNTKAHRAVVDRNIACADALTFNYWAPSLFD
jgi:type I restriction-modification system DNA methylase subunit